MFCDQATVYQTQISGSRTNVSPIMKWKTCRKVKLKHPEWFCCHSLHLGGRCEASVSRSMSYICSFASRAQLSVILFIPFYGLKQIIKSKDRKIKRIKVPLTRVISWNLAVGFVPFAADRGRSTCVNLSGLFRLSTFSCWSFSHLVYETLCRLPQAFAINLVNSAHVSTITAL